ncbi:hypothetical protein OH76DRAFT_644834 [Lentinus brumalis]|uniref:Uncharacterized protein n=1 Tax=Lentinus brumalis TaxID=2498619 RepID=A0A371D7Y9_9APHY|nr:hypothetical protein OH76DRAFT_644834 [Polyporus brumalis]
MRVEDTRWAASTLSSSVALGDMNGRLSAVSEVEMDSISSQRGVLYVVRYAPDSLCPATPFPKYSFQLEWPPHLPTYGFQSALVSCQAELERGRGCCISDRTTSKGGVTVYGSHEFNLLLPVLQHRHRGAGYFRLRTTLLPPDRHPDSAHRLNVQFDVHCPGIASRRVRQSCLQ